jgi:Na+/citrate or Na+/malate symporter
MKKLRKSQKKVAPPKKSVRTTLREDAGTYLLDISTLIFGSVVLGRILQRELNIVDGNILYDIVLTGGITASIITFIVGLILGKREIKTEKTSFHRKKRGRR